MSKTNGTNRLNGNGYKPIKPPKFKKDGTPSKQGEGGGNYSNMKWTAEVLDELADELLTFMKIKKHIFIKEFSIAKKFPAQYFEDFAKRSEKFDYILKIVKDIQEVKLSRMGMKKNYNPAMPIFLQKSISGLRDRVEFTGANGAPLFQNITYHFVKSSQVPKVDTISKN